MMYGLLVFLKCFHWITADRVDYVSRLSLLQLHLYGVASLVRHPCLSDSPHFPFSSCSMLYITPSDLTGYSADLQMDQIPAPGPPTSFHIRIATITTLLSTTDLLLVYYSLDSILTYGVSAKVLFVSEFMVLLASICGTMARYTVNCLDIRRARGREDAPGWERKSMYMFYIDLAVGKSSLSHLHYLLWAN